MISPGVVLSQPPSRIAPSIGMRAQQLLGLHGQEVAVEHGGRLDERLGQRDGRQLQRKAARLQHAALHIFGARAQVRVAGVDVAPGVDDADHRLAAPILGVVADLAQARAMPERAQVLHAEPAMRAQVLRASCVLSWCCGLARLSPPQRPPMRVPATRELRYCIASNAPRMPRPAMSAQRVRHNEQECARDAAARSQTGIAPKR